MAGDWIKMRPALISSPKVSGIVRLLEYDRDTGLALTNGRHDELARTVTKTVTRYVTVASLLVIWGAANEHTTDGVFMNTNLEDLDDLCGVPGFGAAMESVGWAVYDEELTTVTLPNFNEYNVVGNERGKTAAERQRRYRERKAADSPHIPLRDSDVTRDVTSNAREDKTREDKKEAKTTARPRGSRLPDDWEPTAGDADFARSIGADPSAIAPSFRDYWHGVAGAKAVKLDWSATWRNWCRRDTPKARPAPPAATNTTLGVSPKREETPQTKLQGAISYAEGMINMGVWDKAKARDYVAEQKAKLGVP